jgi:uncharacterized protein (DUF58 family)
VSLTWTGWGTLATGIALMVAAYALGYPELAVLGAGCILAVLAGLAWAVPSARLVVRRQVVPAGVTRGEAAVAVVTAVNAGRWPCPGLVAEDACGDHAVAVRVPALPPRGARRVSYRLPTERRGRIAVGPLRVVRADPLGVARRVMVHGETGSLVVRPRVHALPVSSAGRDRRVEGTTADSALNGAVVFHSLREYAPGDEPRRIHWRSSARAGTLMTRQLVDETRARATVVLDVRAAAYEDEDAFELAVEAAASIASAYAEGRWPVRLLTTAGPLAETRGGPGDADVLLDRLAVVEVAAAGTGVRAACEPLRHSRPGGLLAVVTGGAGPAELRALRSLRAVFGHVAAVRVGTASEVAPRPAGVACVDARSPEELVAGWQREVVR